MGSLNVSQAIRNPGQGYGFDTEVVIEPMEVLGDPVHFVDVRVQGEYTCTGEDRISVAANVAATVETRCSRCLEPVSAPISAAIDAVFVRKPDPDDPDLYSYEASTVELTDAVRDALLLELPMRMLCSEDCRGLCPVCGVNLNRNTCTCQEGAEVMNPFSALKNIVLNEEV